jgi:hypothetical protein
MEKKRNKSIAKVKENVGKKASKIECRNLNPLISLNFEG